MSYYRLICFALLLFLPNFLYAQLRDYVNAGLSASGVNLTVKPIKFQKNKLNNEGKPVGKWTNVYLLNKITYKQNSDIPDWEKSLTPFQGNYQNVVTAFSGIPNSLQYFRPVMPYDVAMRVVFETCEYVDGKKTGQFNIQLCELVGGSWEESLFTEIISGTFLNDKFEGKIEYSIDTTSTWKKFQVPEKTPSISLMFQDGILLDQTVSCNDGIRFYMQFDENGSDSNFQEYKGKYKTTYVFKSGKITEALYLNNKFPCYFYSNGNTGYNLRYTNYPICYNSYSFLTQEEKEKFKASGLGFIDLNTNRYSIEYVPLILKSDEILINGNYRLFKPMANLADTSFLWASYHFSEGKRNGIAEIWDYSKNGKEKLIPFIRLNFLDDKLNGISEMFYPDHKLAVSAEFKNGLPSGWCKAYNNAPNSYPFIPNFTVNAYLHSGGILSIHQIGKFGKDLDKDIEIAQKHGSDIVNPKGYELCSEILYRIDSAYTGKTLYRGSVIASDFYRFSNGKPVVKFVVNPLNPREFADEIWFNSSGKIVHSLSEEKRKREQESFERQNTVVTCDVCKKNVLNKDSYFLWNCNCKKSNGANVEFTRFETNKFCSIQCKHLFLKDYCSNRGLKFE